MAPVFPVQLTCADWHSGGIGKSSGGLPMLVITQLLTAVDAWAGRTTMEKKNGKKSERIKIPDNSLFIGILIIIHHKSCNQVINDILMRED